MKNRTATIVSCTKRLQRSLAVLLLIGPVVVAQQSQISGVVCDPTGASIAQASVEFQTSSGEVLRTRTSERGEFVLLTRLVVGTLRVQAAGFTPVTIDFDGTRNSQQIQVRLDPAPLLERIVVAAEQERIPPTPTSEYAIGKQAIAWSGALTIDEVLRQAPGFS